MRYARKIVDASSYYIQKTGVSVTTEDIITKVFVTAHTYKEDENGAIEIN